MTTEEANSAIQFHAGNIELPANHNDLEGRECFLGMLRPYQGLRDESFHHLMEAILVMGETACKSSLIDRELTWALWEIVSQGRTYRALLQSNTIISQNDLACLDSYLDTLEKSILLLLRGDPPRHAVRSYAVHVTRFAAGGNLDYFVGLMDQFLAHEVEEIDDVVSALKKIGPSAHPALANLRSALTRTYTLYEPHLQCTAEVHALLRDAIRSIEGDTGG